MERQILLYENVKENKQKRMNQLLEILNLFNTTKSLWKCNFDLAESDIEFLSKIKNNEEFKMNILFTKKSLLKKVFSRIEIVFPQSMLFEIIRFGIIKEINMSITCDSVKLFLNDNDGDFLIIDTKKYNYKIIKNEINNIL